MNIYRRTGSGRIVSQSSLDIKYITAVYIGVSNNGNLINNDRTESVLKKGNIYSRGAHVA